MGFRCKSTRASAARLCCPPDISEGRRSINSTMPTFSKTFFIFSLEDSETKNLLPQTKFKFWTMDR